MTEKLTNQQREYEAQQMHRQHLQVCKWTVRFKVSGRKFYDISSTIYKNQSITRDGPATRKMEMGASRNMLLTGVPSLVRTQIFY